MLTGAIRVEAASALGHGPLILEASEDSHLDLFLDNAAQTILLLEGNLDATSTATVYLSNGHLLNVDQTFDSRFQGSLFGSGSLLKTGTGVLRLTRGPNTFSGTLEVAQGVLEVTESSQPSEVSQIVIKSGGQLRLSSSGERIYTFGQGPLTLARPGRDSGESAAKGALRQDGGDSADIAIVTNPTELNDDIVWTHANRDESVGSILLLEGAVSGTADLRKTGGGTLELRGDNRDFTGGTLIENGLLRVAYNSHLGTGSLTFVDPERERID